MSEFSKKNYFERRKLSIEELVKYYCELRKYEYQQGTKLKGIELRKHLYCIVSLILKMDQIFSKEKFPNISPHIK